MAEFLLLTHKRRRRGTNDSGNALTMFVFFIMMSVCYTIMYLTDTSEGRVFIGVITILCYLVTVFFGYIYYIFEIKEEIKHE